MFVNVLSDSISDKYSLYDSLYLLINKDNLS